MVFSPLEVFGSGYLCLVILHSRGQRQNRRAALLVPRDHDHPNDARRRKEGAQALGKDRSLHVLGKNMFK